MIVKIKHHNVIAVRNGEILRIPVRAPFAVKITPVVLRRPQNPVCVISREHKTAAAGVQIKTTIVPAMWMAGCFKKRKSL